MESTGQRSSVVEQLFRKQQVGSSILPVGSTLLGCRRVRWGAVLGMRLRAPIESYADSIGPDLK